MAARSAARRARRAAAVAAIAVAGVTPEVLAAPDHPTTIYVATWGDDGAAGTQDEPVETVRHAVWRARSGDTIVLRDGVYRENVQIYGKALTVTSAPGERAVFDGTRELTGWRRGAGDWFVDGWIRQFPRERSAIVAADAAEAGYPDQVFADGRPLRQVLERDAVGPGTFFHDTTLDRIHVGDDPDGVRVEASFLPWAIYLNDADGSRLINLTIRRFATPSADLAAVRVHADDVVVSGVTSELNAAAGISAIGRNIVVRTSRFADNGHLGVHVHAGETIVVEDSVIVGNNSAGFDPRHSAGGIKVTSSTGVTVRDNVVSRNGGPGIWTDLATRDATISYNLVEDNGRSGIEVELSRNVNVVSNIAHGNGEAGIWVLESQDVQVAHNAAIGNVVEIYVLEGPRDRVTNVSVVNNVIGDGLTPHAPVVEDWTAQRSVEQMAVRQVANVDRSRQPVTLALGGWRTRTFAVETPVLAHGRSAFGSQTPMLTGHRGAGPGAGAVVVRSGTAVAGSLASELGVAHGSRLPVGPRPAPRS